MYLKKIRLQNVKCFEDVTLTFPHRDGDYNLAEGEPPIIKVGEGIRTLKD